MTDELLDDPAAERPDELDILDEDLQGEVEAQNDDIDDGLDALDAAIVAFLVAFFRRARAAVAEQGGVFTPAAAQAVAAELEDAVDAGLPKVVQAYAEMFEPAATQAVKVYEAFGVAGSLDGVDPNALRAMAEETIARFEKNIRDTVLSRVGSTLSAAAAGAFSVDDVVRMLRDVEASIAAGTFTRDADEGLTRFIRAVVLAKGRAEGFDVFLFVGPIPGACARCLAVLLGAPHGVQGAYYVDEVQLYTPNVDERAVEAIWAGMHPNCRHWWVGVPDDVLAELGFVFRRGGPDRQALAAEAERATAQAKAVIREMRKRR